MTNCNKEQQQTEKNNFKVGTRRGNAPVPLSILDSAFTGKGISAIEAIGKSIEMAKLADRRGFSRYWVAEHHSMPAVSTSSPAVMLARLIGETKNIRLGAGGMMLPNFPPLVIAEQFGMLEAMAPGRIDLGIGRAPGTDGFTACAIRGTRKVGAENYVEQLEELLHFLDNDFPEDHQYKDRVWAVPGPGQDSQNGIERSLEKPTTWLLGSSDYSARLAGQRGLPFAFAAQLSLENLEMAFDIYRKNFEPSVILDRPYTLACFAVFAGDTEEIAQAESQSSAHSMMRMMKGQSYVMPSTTELAMYPYTPQEKYIMENWRSKMIYGTAEMVVDKLNKMQNITAADELMIVNLGHSPERLVHSAKLIADAYQMPEM